VHGCEADAPGCTAKAGVSASIAALTLPVVLNARPARDATMKSSAETG
jgi:hypothetical protein